jgi:hypothetical protein
MTPEGGVDAEKQLSGELPKTWGEAIAATPNPFAIAASHSVVRRLPSCAKCWAERPAAR